MLGQIGDYLLLLLSLVFLLAEGAATCAGLLIPRFTIDWLSSAIEMLLPPGAEELEVAADPETNSRAWAVANAEGFVELCAIHGFEVREHLVTTKDGYVLGVHEIRPQQKQRRGVVYLHHGLLMSSEVWVANCRKEESIALQLASAGYEVWLGNNRGNKYSQKHLRLRPSSAEFWDFCIDDFALRDIPDTVSYVLRASGAKKLGYVGFSQGSAQAFAALSTQIDLNEQIGCFVALGPAMSPPSVGPRLLQSLMRASPSLLYILFGRRAVLRSTAFWQSVVLPRLFIKMIDWSNELLFRWRSRNISFAQKVCGYYHLYSYTSVKCVVHWFQIIMRNNGMYMYDDNAYSGVLTPVHSRAHFYQPLRYPTRNIRTPIEVIYGTQDTLVDINALLAELPPTVNVHEVSGYEHLEMIWGRGVSREIAPLVLKLLAKHLEN